MSLPLRLPTVDYYIGTNFHPAPIVLPRWLQGLPTTALMELETYLYLGNFLMSWSTSLGGMPTGTDRVMPPVLTSQDFNPYALRPGIYKYSVRLRVPEGGINLDLILGVGTVHVYTGPQITLV